MTEGGADQVVVSMATLELMGAIQKDAVGRIYDALQAEQPPIALAGRAHCVLPEGNIGILQRKLRDRHEQLHGPGTLITTDPRPAPQVYIGGGKIVHIKDEWLEQRLICAGVLPLGSVISDAAEKLAKAPLQSGGCAYTSSHAALIRTVLPPEAAKEFSLELRACPAAPIGFCVREAGIAKAQLPNRPVYPGTAVAFIVNTHLFKGDNGIDTCAYLECLTSAAIRMLNISDEGAVYRLRIQVLKHVAKAAVLRNYVSLSAFELSVESEDQSTVTSRRYSSFESMTAALASRPDLRLLEASLRVDLRRKRVRTEPPAVAQGPTPPPPPQNQK
jgi:hypothetical protein